MATQWRRCGWEWLQVSSRQPRSLRRTLLVLAGLGGIGAGVLVGLALWAEAVLNRPGPLPAEASLVVPRGLGVAAIADRLAAAGIVDSALVFTLAARLGPRLGPRLGITGGPLRAGEYAFAAEISIREAIALLSSGDTVVRRLTFAEGLTTTEMLARIAAAEGLEGPIGEPPGEGELLPDTYHFSYGDRRRDLVARMRRERVALLDSLWPDRAPGLRLADKRAAAILASIVEKETGLAAERARIAAVFHNRLRRGMPLQSDPTVVYGITEGRGPLGRELTRRDLKFRSPYNTYLVTGLPPTPIANPGRAALIAVLHPAGTDELYFVADGKGGHLFARGLAEHNRNVARWRRIRRERRASPE